VSEHETALLGAYVLGVLDLEEQGSVRAHLDGCAPCRREVEDLREMEQALGELPPEAFLEGPPPGGDLLLRRTIDEVRREHHRQTWRNRALLATAAALAVVVALGGGAWLGRSTATPEAVATTPAGTRTAAVTDAATGVTMSAEVIPAAGWVRVHAVVSGVPAGEQCRLVVVAADGSREQAGSWLAAASGTTTVDGAALMAPADVTAVLAETYAGQILVTIPV
jgi:RNA polymerase sigma-70 factor (ECF subfamily)